MKALMLGGSRDGTCIEARHALDSIDFPRLPEDSRLWVADYSFDKPIPLERYNLVCQTPRGLLIYEYEGDE